MLDDVSPPAGTPISKKNRGGRRTSYGIKKAVLVPLRVSSLKSSAAEAFVVPFTALSQKNMTGDIRKYTLTVLILSQNWHLVGVKKI